MREELVIKIYVMVLGTYLSCTCILSHRAAQQEIAALSQMAVQLNSKLAVTEQVGDSVDLDNLFAFLSDVQPNRNQIIDEIGERMNELVEDLDVEVCSDMFLVNHKNRIFSSICLLCVKCMT
jgi:hypothetical protein